MQAYPARVVDSTLKALKLDSSEARLKFPRLLQIVEQHPEETLSLMTREVSAFVLAEGSETEPEDTGLLPARRRT